MWSSDLSSYGSLSRPSPDSRSPLTKVPLEDLTSLMKIWASDRSSQEADRRAQEERDGALTLPCSAQTSACVLLRTLESK